MKIKPCFVAVFSLTLAWLVAACAQPGAPPGTKAPPQPTTAVRSAWEQEWADTLALARVEGAVAISTTWKPEMTRAVGKAFSEKYGINVEFSLAGRGSEQVAKVQAQQRAGLFLVDFFGGGSTTALNLLKPEGLLGPMEPLLILPEIKDPKVWLGGEPPFLDKEKQFMGLLAQKQIHIIFNTDLIKKSELTGYKDLLKPAYRGKITMNDPSTSGAGASMMTHLAFSIWNVEEAKDYLRQLIREQKIVIQRDNRLAVETVARGKFAIGLGSDQQNLSDFLAMGAPLDGVPLKEGYSVSAGSGGLAIPTRLAHPNAAKVFLNWIMTREGLHAFSQGAGTMSMRNDVVVQGISPLFVFQPGEKLFMQTEEKALQMGQMVIMSKQIVDELVK